MYILKCFIANRLLCSRGVSYLSSLGKPVITPKKTFAASSEAFRLSSSKLIENRLIIYHIDKILRANTASLC